MQYEPADLEAPPPTAGAAEGTDPAGQSDDGILSLAELAEAEEFLDRLSEELDSVEAALARLGTESGERCEICGGTIDLEVLRERPLTTVCGNHLLPG
jgi:RNA polymerase-binding transcription factor DksA